MSKFRGFTLVELLVTISIIAVLAAIGLVIYSSVIKQGRDSKRQSDFRSIQSALEQYYADNFVYPPLSIAAGTTCPTDGTLKFGCALKKGSKTYLNTVPTAPTGAYVYVAVSGSDPYVYNDCDNSPTINGIKCTSYCLLTKLENGNNDPNTTPSMRQDACFIDPNDRDYNFVVTTP